MQRTRSLSRHESRNSEPDPLLQSGSSAECASPPVQIQIEPEKISLFQNRPESVSSRRKWKDIIIVICLWITYLSCNAAFSMIAPFFPEEAKQQEGVTPIIIGVILSSSPFCVVILSPIFGYLVPHFGVRFMILSGLLLIGGSFVLLGFVMLLSPSWVFIMFCILLRMTEGIGSAFFFTAIFAVLPKLFPNNVGTISGLFEVSGGLGFAVGPPIGGLLYQLGGFKLPFIATGVCVLFFIIPCALLIRRDDSAQEETPSLKLVFKVLTSLVFFVLVLANILSIASFSFFNPTLEPFLTDKFKLTPLHIGLVMLSGPGAYMISALLVGKLSDKLGPRYFIISGLLLFGIGYFFVGPADFIGKPKLWLTIVSFAVIGVGAAMALVPIYPNMLSIAKRDLELKDDNSITGLTAVVSGIISSSLSFGEFMGPLIGGALTEHFSFPSSTVFFGEVLLAEGFLLLGVTIVDKCIKTK